MISGYDSEMMQNQIELNKTISDAGPGTVAVARNQDGIISVLFCEGFQFPAGGNADNLC